MTDGSYLILRASMIIFMVRAKCNRLFAQQRLALEADAGREAVGAPEEAVEGEHPNPILGTMMMTMTVTMAVEPHRLGELYGIRVEEAPEVKQRLVVAEATPEVGVTHVADKPVPFLIYGTKSLRPRDAK